MTMRKLIKGEVESIAQMKPKAPSEHEDGLLEYLEDIIGTSKYKEPIEETLIEVDKHNEERAHKLNRLRIVEKEKNLLEDAKRETENYLRLQNDLARAQSRLYQWHIWQARTDMRKLQGMIVSRNNTRLGIANRYVQEDHETQLVAEIEKNKDDIAHAEQLQKHYEERVATYEVLEFCIKLENHLR
jgi:structural maintenance of chromosome 4